jgi:uncharacterized protein
MRGMSTSHASLAAMLRGEGVFAEPKFRRLLELIGGLRRSIVAYSGGADSAFLLQVAHAALGDDVLGVLGISESLDRNESRDALAVAARIGAPVRTVETREYEREEYRLNDGNRCYHCKTELFSVLRRLADSEGYRFVLDGSNADDLGDFRPGMRARDEQGVRSPLQEAGLTKAEIRDYSRALGLPTWDKPAAPCLSSRIPYGSPVTFEKLRQVEAAEAALRALGFRIVRVRHHESLARVEVPLEDLPRLVEAPLRDEAVRRLKEAGFLFVAFDLEGFRSGSLNAALSAPQAPPPTQPIPLAEIRRLP